MVALGGVATLGDIYRLQWPSGLSHPLSCPREAQAMAIRGDPTFCQPPCESLTGFSLVR